MFEGRFNGGKRGVFTQNEALVLPGDVLNGAQLRDAKSPGVNSQGDVVFVSSFDAADGSFSEGVFVLRRAAPLELTSTVIVNNVAPSVNAYVREFEDGLFELIIDFDDPGLLDQHSVAIDWGDGAIERIKRLGSGERTVVRTHQYDPSAPQAVTIGATVADDDG
ncbi:MAG: hypothetical protein N2C14_00500, partial [Planctomycetales bacterium]